MVLTLPVVSSRVPTSLTPVTVAKTGAAFATQRLRENGIPESQGRILCMDYREIPKSKGAYNKISCLEMAEHVGLRRYRTFLKEIYELLSDDGLLVFQVAGLRKCWQFEDLIWGIFMNKYVFPGADASLNLGWVINELEGAGFEVKSVDVLGVHYAATIHRWYKNWLSNKENVEAKYGPRWFRIWAYFLAYSVIVARQGSSSVFQITLHKNLNGFHRIEQVPTHAATQAPVSRKITSVESHKNLWPKAYGAVEAPAFTAPAATPAVATPVVPKAATVADEE
jgi:cyclopropane fatty-acyl-phospholipid synthase-like methyltransferase